MRSPELLVRCAVRMTFPDSVTLIPLAGCILPWLVFTGSAISDQTPSHLSRTVLEETAPFLKDSQSLNDYLLLTNILLYAIFLALATASFCGNEIAVLIKK